MFNGIGPTEVLIVLGIVLLLFGGRKLPELARGSGKALRIFKTEVKAMHDDDETDADANAKPASLETVKASEQDKKPEQG
ncbi:twin-arginine translocase TatA/TatE family subunit [Aeromicrobium sp.]|uniref:twin-arginine translocase TatA/TatE family subunit n=1 Tax=Aeromicrobium sp. TaxID=1871063 RepID=UPI0030C23136